MNRLELGNEIKIFLFYYNKIAIIIKSETLKYMTAKYIRPIALLALCIGIFSISAHSAGNEDSVVSADEAAKAAKLDEQVKLDEQIKKYGFPIRNLDDFKKYMETYFVFTVFGPADVMEKLSRFPGEVRYWVKCYRKINPNSKEGDEALLSFVSAVDKSLVAEYNTLIDMANADRTFDALLTDDVPPIINKRGSTAMQRSLYYQGFNPEFCVPVYENRDFGEDFPPLNMTPSYSDLKREIVVRDAKKAFEYSKIASTFFDSSNLMNLYFNGIGTEKNVLIAANIFPSAFTFSVDEIKKPKNKELLIGYARSLYLPLYAYMLYHGIAVEKDREKCDAILSLPIYIECWKNFYCGWFVPKDFDFAVYCLELVYKSAVESEKRNFRRDDVRYKERFCYDENSCLKDEAISWSECRNDNLYSIERGWFYLRFDNLLEISSYWAAQNLADIYSGKFKSSDENAAKAEYWQKIADERRRELILSYNKKEAGFLKKYESIIMNGGTFEYDELKNHLLLLYGSKNRILFESGWDRAVVFPNPFYSERKRAAFKKLFKGMFEEGTSLDNWTHGLLLNFSLFGKADDEFIEFLREPDSEDGEDIVALLWEEHSKNINQNSGEN